MADRINPPRERRLRVLLEMRPALEGYAGIPQETRLLFSGLAQIDSIEMLGLIQSGNLPIAPGLPLRRGELAAGLGASEHIDRLSRVVVSLQQGRGAFRVESLRKHVLRLFGPAAAAAMSLFGGKVALTAFDPTHFKDFVWRAMFAKSLPFEEFGTVTTREYRLMRWPWSPVSAVGVVSGWLGHAVYPRLDTAGIDVMLVETPYPGRVSGTTQMIVRYHDAIPLLMPHTIKDRGYHRAAHFHALRRNAADGAWFACVSEATRADLLSVLPEVESRTVTIPNMIPHHFAPEPAPSTRVPEVVWARKARTAPYEGGAAVASVDTADGTFPYLLMVSTIEPRKNHLALLDAWELLRADGHPQLNLVCVGAMGWEHETILRRMAPWLQRGGLHLLTDVPSADLRLLYRHAQATVCPSLGEGFDYSGVEAMRCGGVVVASDIRVHRDVYDDAAEYFNPYDARQIAQALARVIGPGQADRRDELMQAGARVSARYLPEVVLPQWGEFLARFRR